MEIHGYRGKHEYVPMSQARIDESVQRPANPQLVKDIKTHFNIDALGFPVLSKRGPHDYVILDGQTRITVWRQMFGDNPMACRVLENLSHEEEAELFLKLNNEKPVRTLDRAFVRRTAGDPTMVDIFRIVEAHDFKIARGGGKDRIPAVHALEYAYRLGQLDHTLYALAAAWPDNIDATNNHIIKGVALFLKHDKVNYGSAIEKMRTYPGGPRQLLNDAMTGRSDGNRYSRVCGELLIHYNKRRRSGRIETEKDNGARQTAGQQ